MMLSFASAAAHALPAALVALSVSSAAAFSAHHPQLRWCTSSAHSKHHASSSALLMSDQPPDEDGADLAAEFFKAVSDRNIAFDGDEIDFAEAEEAEMESDPTAYPGAGGVVGGEYEGEMNYAPADEGENASVDLDDEDDAILREYDVSGEGSLTDGQVYDELKERVLESAGAFVELTKGAEEGEVEEGAAKAYVPPTNVPDSGLTAGEVVELVLAALRNNDMPSSDYGLQVLFGYSSPESQIAEMIESEGLTPDQYKRFLSMSEDNLALFQHTAAKIDKADFSPDGLKGYFTARLIGSAGEGGAERPEDVSVNFILSTTGTDDGDCWLIDSILIRPSKLRRRRRR
ncbi:hypothetical protein ACHAXT_007859 [Thalassiosira profunda]